MKINSLIGLRISMVTAFLLIAPLWATGEVSDTADIYEIKGRVESVLSKKVRRVIETRLEPEDFSVSVSIKMVRDEKPSGVKVKELGSDKNNALFPGLSGYVSANTIMSIYEKELLESGRKIAKFDSELSDLQNYRITGFSVSVGLLRKFGDGYGVQLQKWLSNSVKQEFGRDSLAEVNQVEEKAQPFLTGNAFENKMERFQWSLVAMVFLLLSFLGIIAYHWFRSRLRKAELKHRAMLKQLDLETDKDLDAARKSQLQKEAEYLRAQRENQEFEGQKFEIQKRVVATLKNLPNPGSAITALLGYENGGQKVAALVDSTYAIEGHQTVTFTLPSVFFQLEIVESQKKAIQKAFFEYKSLAKQDQLKVLENCLWSLASIGILSDYQDQKRFQYLRQVPAKTLPNILKKATMIDQAVALLHLSNDHQRTYVENMNETDRVNLIREIFEYDSVPQESLNRINSVFLENFKEAASGFSVVEGGLDMIRNLRAVDEIKILRKLSQTNGQVTAIIKKSVLSLAYLDEWNDDSVRRVLEGFENIDLIGLIQQIPSARLKIISNISEMMAKIVDDDINRGIFPETIVQEKSLENIRLGLRKLEEGGFLSLHSVFEKDKKGEVVRLAQ